MDILPDELLPLLFRTPACVFVCKRLCGVLLRHHRVGLLDYYVLKLDGGVVVKKLDGTPEFSDGNDVFITYGKPIITTAAADDMGKFTSFIRDKNGKVQRAFVHNCIARIHAFVDYRSIYRLMPKQRVIAALEFRTAALGRVPRVVRDSTKCTVGYAGNTVDGIVPHNSRTWPLIMWQCSLEYLQSSVVSKKMYHTHLVPPKPEDLIIT